MQVKPTTRVGTVEVTADGEGLVSHAGMGLLAELSDRTGLTAALSDALTGTRERHSAHDPGWVNQTVRLKLVRIIEGLESLDQDDDGPAQDAVDAA